MMIDMTALGDSIPGSSAGVRAEQLTEPSARVVRQHRVCAEGFMGFLGIVKSLTQTPHSLPELPNLKPVADDLHSPATFDMSYSDNDGIWTVDDSLESACVVDIADQQSSLFEQKPMHVHAVQYASQDTQVVVDSGSDASCLPLSWAGIGLEGGKDPNSYRDAQGDAIKRSQTRAAVLQIGETKFKERWLLSSVTQPLFSVGKLLKQGWNIIHDSQLVPHLTSPDGQVRVPMHYQHNSLHATGTICNVKTCTDSPQAVRALEVRDPWLSLKDAFEEVGPGVYARRDFSASLIDCSVALHHLGVQFRTTIRQDSTGWNVFELNQDVTLLEQHEAEFEPSRLHQVITIGSCERVDVNSLFGKVPPPTLSTTSEATTTTAVAAGVGDEPDEDMYVPDFEHEDILNEEQLPPEPKEQDEALPQQGHLVVDGIELHEHCTLSTIRAAATKLGLGKSGGKTTVLERIRSHLAKQRLLETHELSHGDAPALPREQTPVVGPSAEQKPRHSLCHIPFEPWCEFCTAYRARADKHLQARPESRENSTVAFDFCFTERATGVKGDKLVVLIMKDVHTHAIAAIPTPAKGGSIAYRYLVHEAVKFLNFCGSNPVTLKSDSEPACLALQQGIKDLRARMKLGTILEQTEKGDHQANPAEQAVDQIRQLTGTILAELEDKANCKVSTMSPLHAWCWRHASWCSTRFAGANSPSAFELITGRPYQGKLVNFGEVVFGRVKSAIKGKPRWVKMMWLGKLGVSDLHVGITGQGMFIATRSVRRLPSPDSYQSSFFEILKDQPWTQAAFLSGNLGSARAQKTTDADEQAVINGPVQEAPEPLENPEPLPYPGYLLPDSASLAELIPPPPLLAAGTPEPATPVQTNAQAQQGSSDMQVEPSAFTPLPSEPATAQENFPTPSGLSGLGGLDPSPEPARPSGLNPSESAEARSVRPGGAGGAVEPSTKRPRLILRLDAVRTDSSGNELHHVDEQVELVDEAAESFLDCQWDEWDEAYQEDDIPLDQIPSILVRPFTESEPVCSPSELMELDHVADQYELARLEKMGVLAKVDYKLDEHRSLTTKSVRTWRPKVLGSERVWLYRSRLVAREYAHLDPYRQGLFAPTTASIMTRVVPALFMQRRQEQWTMMSLDVSDAFLMCEQQHPTVTRINDTWHKLHRMVPGQRDGSVTWYTTFTSALQEGVGAELLIEQPSLFRLPELSGVGNIHVDDMLSTGPCQVLQKVEAVLDKEKGGKFKVSSEWLHDVGDEISFLKRRHKLVTASLLVIEPNVKYIDKLMQVTGLSAAKGRYKATPFPTGQLPTDQAIDAPLDAETSSRYRSAVGILMYLSTDLIACQFGIRYLSTYSHCPTEGSWKLLRHLATYAHCSQAQVLGLEEPILGKGIIRDRTGHNVSILEIFSDADWSGNKRTRKSVSSAIIAWNSNVLYSHSKTQKNVSLSSAESEYHSLVSAVSDAVLLKACIAFVTADSLESCVFCDNMAARTLATRQGVGRMRHASGKLLWLQEKTKSGEFDMRPVPTADNVSDLGTKPLKADRITKLLAMCNFRDSENGYQRIGQAHLLDAASRHRVKSIIKSGTVNAKQVLQILTLALQVDSTMSQPDALSQDEEEEESWMTQVMSIILQAFFFSELYEQFPVPFLIAAVMTFFFVWSVARIASARTILTRRANANTTSLEVTIEARVVQGSTGARDSPEPAYPSDTSPDRPRASTAAPDLVQTMAKAQVKAKAKGKSKAKAKARVDDQIDPVVEARLRIAQPARVNAAQAAQASQPEAAQAVHAASDEPSPADHEGTQSVRYLA